MEQKNPWRTVEKKNERVNKDVADRYTHKHGGGRRSSRRYDGDRKNNHSILRRVADGSLNPDVAVKMINSGYRSNYRRPVPVKPYYRVTRSGALAVYGFSPRPVVLYANQWNKLLKHFEHPDTNLTDFISTHEDELREVNFTHRTPGVKRVETDARDEGDAGAGEDADVETNVNLDVKL